MIELRVTENGVLLQAKIVTNAKSPSIAGVIGDSWSVAAALNGSRLTSRKLLKNECEWV